MAENGPFFPCKGDVATLSSTEICELQIKHYLHSMYATPLKHYFDNRKKQSAVIVRSDQSLTLSFSIGPLLWRRVSITDKTRIPEYHPDICQHQYWSEGGKWHVGQTVSILFFYTLKKYL